MFHGSLGSTLRRSSSWTQLTILTLVSGATMAYGQATTSIRGAVRDPSGAVVPEAHVTLASPVIGFSRATITASDGVYQFLQVPPGTYSVTVNAPGFKPAQLAGVRLLVNTPSTADLVLQVGTQTDQVAVTGEAPTLNMENATLGNAFQEQQVRELPIESRNVIDLLSLQPGAAYTSNRTDVNLDKDTRSGSVNGARSDQTAVTMDGVTVTDQVKGYAFKSVVRTTPDALQEFRVTTINPTAADGNSAGAQVALVTKSGTNQFHGNLYEYLRNTATSANDYFIKLAQDQSHQPNKAPKLNRNIYGGSFGGAIKKDRMFFFANYEGRKDRQADSVVTQVPTAAARAGNLVYLNSSGGITTITPGNLTQWDPLHVGPNPAILKYYNSFPLPNDTSVGDNLNYSGYRFAAPSSANLQVVTSRLDYKIDQKGSHNLFIRASGQNDFSLGDPFVPGGPPTNTVADRSKGLALGYTALLKPTLINEFRYGFTRSSVGNLGDSSQPYVALAGFPQGITRSSTITSPVHNFVDNVTWIKGKHTIQFGFEAQLIHEKTYNTGFSYSTDTIGTTAVIGGGVALTGLAFDPGAQGFPAVSRTYTSGYDQASLNLLGVITTATARYNYDKSGNVLPQGAPVLRNYAMTQYDMFAQDTIRLKPNLTATIGLRYQIETPPYETNGLQVAPNVDLDQFQATVNAYMNAGIPQNQDPVISYKLAGPVNHGDPFYHINLKNFGPRLALAYSPTGHSGWLGRLLGDKKTTIRAGAGVVFDHLGAEVINTYDQNGAYGLSTSLSAGLAGQDYTCAARVTDIFATPSKGCGNVNNGYLLLPAPPGGFPQTPPIGLANGGFRSIWAVDQDLKTPYAYTLNLSVARQLGSDMTLEVSYVGRLSHRLLVQDPYNYQNNIVDPASGVSAYQALSRMSYLVRQNTGVANINAASVGPTAAFWNDLYQPLATTVPSANIGNCNVKGNCTPLQAAYLLSQRYLYDDTFATYFMDVPGDVCATDCSKLGSYVMWNPQLYGITAWQSRGNANYHALQVSLRKRFSRSLQFDLNYVWSKSIDMGSDASRVAPGGGYSQITNQWAAKQTYAVSDFDMTQQINANWVYLLPIGRRKSLLRQAPGWLNTIAGGWQVSGLYRMTTGLPFGVLNGNKIPTGPSNFADRISPVQQGGATKTPGGKVLIFPNQSAALSDFGFAYAGESGSRNVVRGDGVLGLDASLSKRFVMPYNEHHSVQVRWEVFNVGNFTRFNVKSNIPNLSSVTNFGVYTGLLTSPRVMQFGLRYDF